MAKRKNIGPLKMASPRKEKYIAPGAEAPRISAPPLAQQAINRLASQTGNGFQVRQRGPNGWPMAEGASTSDAPVPHIITFTGYTGQFGKIYRNPDEAWRDSHANARYMRNDLSIMECLEARQRAIALLPWHITSDRPKDPLEQDLCKALTTITNMTPRLTELRRCLQEAVWYGRSGLQINYGRKSYYDRQYVVPQKSLNNEAWMPINGDKLAFRYDDGRVGIRIGYTLPSENKQFDERLKIIERDEAQNPIYAWTGERMRKIEYTTEYGRVYFLDEDEMDRIIIHKHMIEDADFEQPLASGSIHGVGIRSRIYWAWFQKQNTMALLMEYLERSALGFEIWTYPLGNSNFLAAVEQAAFNRVGAGKNIVFLPVLPGMPDLCKMEHVETGLAGIELVDSIVHRYFEWQIKRYILGQVLSSEPENGGLGASGLSDFQKGSLFDILAYDARNSEETMTNWVNVLKLKNRQLLPLGCENIPVKFVYDTESDQMERQLEACQRAYEMGLPLRSDDLYAMIGMEKPGPSDESISKAGELAADMAGQVAGQIAGQEGEPGQEQGPGAGEEDQGPEPPSAAVDTPGLGYEGYSEKYKALSHEEKVGKALASYNPSTKAKQDASRGLEQKFSKRLGLRHLGGTKPFDAVHPNGKIHYELKMLHDAKAHRVNMRKDSRQRKEAALEPGHKAYTIAVDNRDKFEGGKHRKYYSGHKYYFREGVGAFHFNQMQKAKSLNHLKEQVGL